MDQAVTVVEWGGGWVEGLSDDGLELVLHAAVRGGPDRGRARRCGERVVEGARGVPGGRVSRCPESASCFPWHSERRADTSSSVSVAVLTDAGDVLASARAGTSLQHARSSARMITAALADAGVAAAR